VYGKVADEIINIRRGTKAEDVLWTILVYSALLEHPSIQLLVSARFVTAHHRHLVGRRLRMMPEIILNAIETFLAATSVYCSATNAFLNTTSVSRSAVESILSVADDAFYAVDMVFRVACHIPQKNVPNHF
jgi:ribonuclease P protein component